MAGFDIKALANSLIDIGQRVAPAFLPGSGGPLVELANSAIDGLQNVLLHPDVVADQPLAERAAETLDQLVTRVEADVDRVADKLGDG